MLQEEKRKWVEGSPCRKREGSCLCLEVMGELFHNFKKGGKCCCSSAIGREGGELF